MTPSEAIYHLREVVACEPEAANALETLLAERDEAREVADMMRGAWEEDCPDAMTPRFSWELTEENQ